MAYLRNTSKSTALSANVSLLSYAYKLENNSHCMHNISSYTTHHCINQATNDRSIKKSFQVLFLLNFRMTQFFRDLTVTCQQSTYRFEFCSCWIFSTYSLHNSLEIVITSQASYLSWFACREFAFIHLPRIRLYSPGSFI